MRFIAVACITASIIIPIHAAENATDKALNAAGAIDFNQPLTTFTGKPLLQRGDCPPPKAGQDDTCDQVITTLGDVATTAPLIQLQADQNEEPLKKFQRDRLARRIYKAKVVLTPEDVALIKDRIGRAYGPVQVGASWPLLDPTLRNAIEDAK